MLRVIIGEFVLVIGAITNMIVNKNIGIYVWNISTKLLVFLVSDLIKSRFKS
jgi:hypothetical protein